VLCFSWHKIMSRCKLRSILKAHLICGINICPILQQELDNRFLSIPTSKVQWCQQKLRKDKQKIMINKTPRWLERIYGRPILHQLCHTALSHFSKQVLERKLQGHELETVLLTNFSKERLIMTGITETIQRHWKISDNCPRCIRWISSLRVGMYNFYYT